LRQTDTALDKFHKHTNNLFLKAVQAAVKSFPMSHYTWSRTAAKANHQFSKILSFLIQDEVKKLEIMPKYRKLTIYFFILKKQTQSECSKHCHWNPLVSFTRVYHHFPTSCRNL